MSVFKDKEKTKDGRQYRFKVYYHKDGKLVPYVSKRYLLKKEAEAEERIFLLNRNNPVKKKFDDVANDYFTDSEVKLREATIIKNRISYNKRIKNTFGNKFIDEINVKDIEDWKNEIRKDMMISSCNRCYYILNEIFKFANRKYEYSYNPVALAGRFREKTDKVVEEKIRYITYEEYQKFISVIDKEMWYAFFTTLYFSGMRVGEIQALNWNDIDFRSNTITINKTLTFTTKTGPFKITNTKNCLTRKIVMSNVLRKVLLDYKEAVKQYGDFTEDWFVFGNGTALRPWNIRVTKNKYFEKADLKQITIHEFRHSHVSLCINEFIKSGQTDSTKFFLMMSQRMGHSLRVMQDVYMHLFPTVQDGIIDLLNNL